MRATVSASSSERGEYRGVDGVFVELDAGLIDREALLDLVVSQRGAFVPSTVRIESAGKQVIQLLEHQRNSLSLLNNPNIAVTAREIEEVILSQMEVIQKVLGIRPFEVGQCESSCVAFGEGSFFGRHRDSFGRLSGDRVLSWVYYFSGDPQPFDGGDLVFLQGSVECARVSPRSGSLIVFKSTLFHQVESVRGTLGVFENSRFTLTGFISARPTLVTRGLEWARRVLFPLRGLRVMRVAGRCARKWCGLAQ